MAILRIAAAAGLLLVLAPEQTLRVAKGMVGMAEEAKSLQPASAETVITYCRTNPQGDTFTWAPIVKMDGREYNAKNEFGGVAGPRRLVTWEKFAQVLLETNELTFVN